MLNRSKAKAAAGFRERYAMEKGTATKKIINGHEIYIFKYSPEDPYQDANGAMWDATRGAWIN